MAAEVHRREDASKGRDEVHLVSDSRRHVCFPSCFNVCQKLLDAKCSGQVISDNLIDFFDVTLRSTALGDMLPSVECSLMLL